MRFRLKAAGSLGVSLLCGTILFSGCGSDDDGARNAGGAGATGKGGSTAGGAGGSAGAATGKGGSGGTTGGTGGGSATVCSKAVAVSGELISDFEGTVATFTGEEINGGYYAYGDPMGGTTTPETSGASAMLIPEEGDHDGLALHYMGEGFPASSWGAGFGVWMRPVDDGTACANAEDLDGISFWARNDRPLRVGATIPATQAAADGGECVAASCQPNSVTVEPNAEWTLVEIPWADFAGGTAPFSPEALLGIDILIPQQTDEDWGFDVWIDDMMFLGGTPSGGGGAPSTGGAPAGGAPAEGGAGGAPSGGGAGGA